MSTVRARNQERTRRDIVAALVALVKERNSLEFTVQEVSTLAQVPVRTVYRYFPTRQDLLDALADAHDRVAEATLPAGLDDYGEWLTLAWSNLTANQLFVRAQGTALRRAQIPIFRDVLRVLVARDHPGLGSERLDDIVDTCLLLSSSAALFGLVDVQQVEPERASRIAAEAIVAVIRAG